MSKIISVTFHCFFPIEILNKEKTASINSYKTELSKGFNRILFACVNDLHAIDKKYRMTLLSDLLTKTS